MLLALDSGRRPVGLMALGDAVALVVVTLTVALVVTILVASFLAERRQTGSPSFLSGWAARMAAAARRPIWDPLPYLVTLIGLAVALLGWRALADGGWLKPVATPLAVVGLAVALLGGVMAGALAHPPRAVVEHVSGEVGHPTPAHRVVVSRGRLGAGPVGGVLVVVGGVLALLVTPVAAVVRVLGGDAVADAMPAHDVVVASVALICVGAWMLRAEGTAAAWHGGAGQGGAGQGGAGQGGAGQGGAGQGGAGQGKAESAGASSSTSRLDLSEAVAAASLLLALSVGVDSGLPPVPLGLAGLATLLVARARAGAGSVLVAVAGYAGARVVVAVLAWGFAAPLVPLAWQAAAAAVGIEVLAGALLAGRGSRRWWVAVSGR